MNNLPIEKLKKEDIQKIKMIVFDVDGVLVPRGTKIKQDGSILTLETKKIPEENVDLIKRLYEKGFHINISSGRGLYMLQNMFREILPFVSLTFENGSATWDKGKIFQHVNSFEAFGNIDKVLSKVKHENIKGFEPKEFIITIHCKERVEEIETILRGYENLYCIWNGEAYDIGVKKIQTKGEGIKSLMKYLGFKKEQVMAIGDNYNDKELLESSGIKISADKTRLEGDFHIPLNGKNLPAYELMVHVLKELNRK